MADNQMKTPKTPKVAGPKTQSPNAAPVETAGNQLAQAPPLFREEFRQRLQNTPVTNQGGMHTAMPVPLETINRDYGALVASMKEIMQENMGKASPEEQSGYFAQGFQQYPEQMAAMVVRMAMNNRLRSDSNVSRWLQMIDQRLGNG